MRFIILILLAAFSPFALSAASPYKLGIGGGYGYNNVIDTGFYKWEDDGVYRIEMTVERAISPHITFESGIWYTNHNLNFSEISDITETFDSTVNITAEYFQVPLLFKPHIPFRYVDIAFPLGVNFAYLFSSKITENNVSVEVEEYIESNQLSVLAGLEFSILFPFSTDLYIGALSEMYVFDFIDDRGPEMENESSYLLDIMIRTGVRYRFK
ncbi:MAG: outer membrane beta-barrel protein [Spirochaetes bacterium]|jgi:hypothetical protein|nr:outer membrane beta-barrel protein [Spirochaetota bacterium]